MPVVEKETIKKGPGRAIVSYKVRSHANDPFFVKKNAEAKEALSKIDLSLLKKK
jgi:hypothetical protein